MAQAASSDDHRVGAGGQDRDRLLHGVDRGQSGVGQRRDVLGLESGTELDHRARRCLEKIGEAAVAIDPGK